MKFLRPVPRRAEEQTWRRMSESWAPQFREQQGFGGARVEPGAGQPLAGRSPGVGDERRLVTRPAGGAHR